MINASGNARERSSQHSGRDATAQRLLHRSWQDFTPVWEEWCTKRTQRFESKQSLARRALHWNSKRPYKWQNHLWDSLFTNSHLITTGTTYNPNYTPKQRFPKRNIERDSQLRKLTLKKFTFSHFSHWKKPSLEYHKSTKANPFKPNTPRVSSHVPLGLIQFLAYDYAAFGFWLSRGNAFFSGFLTFCIGSRNGTTHSLNKPTTHNPQTGHK